MVQNNQFPDGANLSDLNEAVQHTLIHVDLSKTLYGISSAELQVIEHGATSLWKDFTLFSFGVGVPCAVNAIIEWNKQEDYTSELFWNTVISVIAIFLGVIFSIFWVKTNNSCKTLLTDIKNRPRYRMP